MQVRQSSTDLTGSFTRAERRRESRTTPSCQTTECNCHKRTLGLATLVARGAVLGMPFTTTATASDMCKESETNTNAVHPLPPEDARTNPDLFIDSMLTWAQHRRGPPLHFSGHDSEYPPGRGWEPTHYGCDPGPTLHYLPRCVVRRASLSDAPSDAPSDASR